MSKVPRQLPESAKETTRDQANKHARKYAQGKHGLHCSVPSWGFSPRLCRGGQRWSIGPWRGAVIPWQP
eukprot:8682165-Lingulodinium_polyedra.AAC.1